MFVIEASRPQRTWISGVFRRRDDAEAFFASIPANLAADQRLYEIPFWEYPIYLIESEDFRFVTAQEAQQAIELIEPTDVERDDYGYFNLYRLTCDYAPRLPGTDYMGSLPHFHITNCVLDALKSTDRSFFEEIFPGM